MAGLIDGLQQGIGGASEELNRLSSNPIFHDLKATLVEDCFQQNIPFTILSNGTDDLNRDSYDLVVEDAALQADFCQMSALNNPYVDELKRFYNTSSAALVTERSDAIAKTGLHTPAGGQLSPAELAHLGSVHSYYDGQQRRLTQRVGKSLQLLKEKLPLELAQQTATTKKAKSRLLSPKAVDLMSDWYDKHKENPYPTDVEKQDLARSGGVSVAQVKAWFANKRNRSLNTRPKRQKMEMERKLLQARDNLTANQPASCHVYDVVSPSQRHSDTFMHEMSGMAASFGKCFLTDYRPEAFYHMCQMLRVLNAVRDYKVAIPLTYIQLQNLTLKVLIDRLVLRRQYCLAIHICNYLRMPETEGGSRILAHWACHKVQQTNIEDEQIARAISQKLGDTPGVSYSEVANKAIECGRTELAIRLLDYEPKAAEQVPLLMKMKRDQLALTKAIESGDTDLVYTVLLHLQDTMPHGEFLMAIRNMEIAHALYIQYCREKNRYILQDIHYQEDNFIEGANCKIIDSYEDETVEARFGSLTSAQESYSKGKNEWAAKQTEDQIKLLRYQRRLEEEFSRPYLDLSLQGTMQKLIAEGNQKVVEQMRKEFKVPDRRFWWLKVIALAEAGDFIELEKFSRSKKSPIGYEPFVNECMKYGNQVEAQKYLSKVAPENRVKCYVRAGQLDQAAEIAFQQQSEEDLNYILSKCTSSNRGLVEKIQGMKTQIPSRR